MWIELGLFALGALVGSVPFLTYLAIRSYPVHVVDRQGQIQGVAYWSITKHAYVFLGPGGRMQLYATRKAVRRAMRATMEEGV